MREKVFTFIDTETSGLTPGFHQVIEIGAVKARFETDIFGNESFQAIDEKEWKIILTHTERADPGALKVNGYEKRDWSTAVPAAQAYEEFANYISDTVIVAQNVTFDWNFLTQDAACAGIVLDKFPFYLKLDLASIAMGKFFRERSLTRYSLKELAAYLHVTNSDAHTALSDAKTAYAICKKLLET